MEDQIARSINQLRLQNAKPIVPVGLLPTIVAHIKLEAMSKSSLSNQCNWLHSWMPRPGALYSACCFDFQANPNCMWDKAREIFADPTAPDVYEIALLVKNPSYRDPNTIAALFNASQPHRDIILAEGIWKDATWDTLGVGVRDNRITVWFVDDLTSYDQPCEGAVSQEGREIRLPDSPTAKSIDPDTTNQRIAPALEVK